MLVFSAIVEKMSSRSCGVSWTIHRSLAVGLMIDQVPSGRRVAMRCRLQLVCVSLDISMTFCISVISASINMMVLAVFMISLVIDILAVL